MISSNRLAVSRDITTTHRFVNSKHQVHILHRLPAGSLDQIINTGADDRLIHLGDVMNRNRAIVRVDAVISVAICPLGKSLTNGSVQGRLRVKIAQAFFVPAVVQAHVHRRQNAAIDRQQCGEKISDA